MIDKGPKIGDLLVQAGMIDQMQLRAALGHQKRWGGKIGKVLVDLGFLEEEAMLRFLAERFKMKAVNLLRSRITAQTFEAVPENLAKKYQVVPVILREIAGKKTIVVAMNDPSDLRAIDEITFVTGAKVEAVLATDSAIAKVLAHYGNFSPDPREYQFQEHASPSQLRQERQEPQKPEAQRPAGPAARPSPPPAQRPAPPRPAPAVPTQRAPEEEFESANGDNLQLIKGEVTMLKVTKPGARRPAPKPRPDSSPILGQAPKPAQPTASPILGRPTPSPAQPAPDSSPILGRKAPTPAPVPKAEPILEPAPVVSEAPPMEEPPSLPDIAPLPDSESSDSDVLLQHQVEPVPPSLDAPPLPVDFLDDASRAAQTGQSGDSNLEIPEAGEDMQLADAYEFIPPKAEPIAGPPDRPVMVPDEPSPLGEPAGPPPFDPDFLPPAFDAANPPTATAPPEVEWGQTGDDFFSMPVPGGLTDQPGAIPDIPSAPLPGMAATSPLDEEWPPMPEPAGPETFGLQTVTPPAEAPTLTVIPAIPIESPAIDSAEWPTLTPELLTPLTAPEPPAEGKRKFIPLLSDAPPIPPAHAPERRPEVPAPPAEAAPPAPPPAPVFEAPPLDQAEQVWEELPPAPPEPAAVPDASVNLWDEMAAPDDTPPVAAPATPEPAEAAAPPGPAAAKIDPTQSLWDQAAPLEPPAAPPDDLWGSQAEAPVRDEIWDAAPGPAGPPAVEPGNELPPLPDLDWSPPPAASSPNVAPPDWEQMEAPAVPVASAPPPAPDLELMVEEIDSLKEPDPAPRPTSVLPFEAPPPELEELPVVEALPLSGDPGESKPDFEVISEPAGLKEQLPPPAFALDEQVMEVPAYDRTVLKMEPVTVGEEKPAARELPEMVLLPKPEPSAPAPAPIETAVIPGELKSMIAAADESPEIEATRAELERLGDFGEEFLDTREVRDRLSKISELEREIHRKEFQFDDLLSLMMKKELGEITQELFMNELRVLKTKVDESRGKDKK